MRSDFKLVAGRFVNVRGTQNIETLNTGWQWNRALDNGTGTFGRIDDFLSRLVDQFVVERFQADANFLVLHNIFPKNELRTAEPFAAFNKLPRQQITR